MYRFRDPRIFEYRIRDYPVPGKPGRLTGVPHPKWPTYIARPRLSGIFSGENYLSDGVALTQASKSEVLCYDCAWLKSNRTLDSYL
jgi:hypothetical protein